ncbi:MAG: 3-deoxy-D-manno-octulosonic acid transferase [Syntrophus sp. (in: bacteria)]|nr:3-deoxy-D-manno-octulosonic acid transferase [Syntrophus sp. (in: bacteria)]
MLVLYNILLTLAAALAVPYYGAIILFTGKYRHSIGPKFGFNRPDLFDSMQGTPRIWIHAVSVGEVTAAAPIMAALRADFPDACLVLSTGTETGQDMARGLIPEATAIIYYPLDLPHVVRKLIRLVLPDIFVLTETELWPNFLQACRDQGTSVVLVNGRISGRSFKKYYHTRFFWRQILGNIDQMGVISEIDAGRARAIGIVPEKIHVLGNAKYDGLAAKVSPGLREETASRLNLTAGERVLVAGSTHDGEETIVLEVFKKLLAVYSDFKLILVPRHIERAADVMNLVRQSGFDSLALTQIDEGQARQNEKVLVVDRIGELSKVYSLATIVYCGGSLVPKGGQNILEPAAWGKVVFYGPFMDDFRDEKMLLEAAGAGIVVNDVQELADKMLALLRTPETLADKGKAAGQVVAANRGASRRYAALIKDVLLKRQTR